MFTFQTFVKQTHVLTLFVSVFLTPILTGNKAVVLGIEWVYNDFQRLKLTRQIDT